MANTMAFKEAIQPTCEKWPILEGVQAIYTNN